MFYHIIWLTKRSPRLILVNGKLLVDLLEVLLLSSLLAPNCLLTNNRSYNFIDKLQVSCVH